MGARFNMGIGVGQEVLEAIKNARRRIWVVSPWISPDYVRLLLGKAREGVDVRIYTSNHARNNATIRLLTAPHRKELRRPRGVRIAGKVLLIYGVLDLVLLMVTVILGVSMQASGITALAFIQQYMPPLYVITSVIGSIFFIVIGLGIRRRHRRLGKFLLIYGVLGIASIAAVPMLALLMVSKASIWVALGGLVLDIAFIVAGALLLRPRVIYVQPKLPLFLTILSATKDFMPHAKVYIVDDIAYVGSANLSRGGLERNIEAFIRVEDPATVEEIARQVSEIPSKFSGYVVNIVEPNKPVERKPSVKKPVPLGKVLMPIAIALVFIALNAGLTIPYITATFYAQHIPSLTSNATITVVSNTTSIVNVTAAMPPYNLTEVNYVVPGLGYAGPNTTSIAAYYCIRSTNTTEYEQGLYELDLSLFNGEYAYSYSYSFTGNGTYEVSIPGIITGPTLPPCEWLVVTVKNNTVYFGYLNGTVINYFANAQAPAPMIYGIAFYLDDLIPWVNYTYLNVELALYYWMNGTWHPAPTYIINTTSYINGVVNAYINQTENCAVISWPQPINVECPQTPTFRP